MKTPKPVLDWKMLRPGYWKAGCLYVCLDGKSFVAFRVIDNRWNEYVTSGDRHKRFRSFEAAAVAAEGTL